MTPFGVAALIWHPTEHDQNMTPLVLTVSRRGLVDDIGLPGGKVDDGESPLLAIIRECREELGIEIHDATVFFEEADSLHEVNLPSETRKVARTTSCAAGAVNHAPSRTAALFAGQPKTS